LTGQGKSSHNGFRCNGFAQCNLGNKTQRNNNWSVLAVDRQSRTREKKTTSGRSPFI